MKKVKPEDDVKKVKPEDDVKFDSNDSTLFRKGLDGKSEFQHRKVT